MQFFKSIKKHLALSQLHQRKIEGLLAVNAKNQATLNEILLSLTKELSKTAVIARHLMDTKNKAAEIELETLKGELSLLTEEPTDADLRF